jgi:hypothetical protein
MKRMGVRAAIIAVFIMSACAIQSSCSEQNIKGKSDWGDRSGNNVEEPAGWADSSNDADNKTAPATKVREDWGDRSGNNAEEPAGWADSSNDDDNKK